MAEELPPCHLCGNEAVVVVDDVAWCEGCLHARGSCCAEDEPPLAEKPPDV